MRGAMLIRRDSPTYETQPRDEFLPSATPELSDLPCNAQSNILRRIANGSRIHFARSNHVHPCS